MVNVWATFCTPCLNEMPDLGELAAEYESRGVQFVGLVSDTVGADGALDPEQVELAKEAVAETGASYRHLLPSEDLNGLLSQIYAVPTTFFVDSRGRQVGSTYMRAMSREEWEAVLDGILAELPEAGLRELKPENLGTFRLLALSLRYVQPHTRHFFPGVRRMGLQLLLKKNS